LGVESVCELLDVDLYEEIDTSTLPGSMNERLPEGVRVESARLIDSKESLMAVTGAIEYSVETDDGAIIAIIKRNIESRIPFTRETKKGTSEITFDDAVLEAGFDNEGVRLMLSAGDANALRIDRAVMALAELPAGELHRVRLTRLRLFRITESGPVEIA